MDLTTSQSCDVIVYVENFYEGDLNSDSSVIINTIPWTNWLRVWMQLLNSEHDRDRNCEVGLRLTSDRQIQTLNQQYRSIDKPTDVLAFATTESEILIAAEIDEPLYLGDIIISLDTAKKQARSQDHSLITELAWLSSHGFLHLLGWDHPDEVRLEQMLEKQSQMIQLLKI